MLNKTCKLILENKNQFVPTIFTLRQYDILKKQYNNQSLTNTEKTYLYTSIKKKLEALKILKEEYHITGKNMIPERIKKAKEILKNIPKNAFISGSFLFKKTYNDIDIYIISKKRKQYNKNKFHYIYITENDLNKPFFASAALYSVANFQIPNIKVEKKRSSMDEIIMAYQIAISEHIDKEGFKTLKYVIMEYYLLLKDRVLDSFELSTMYDSIQNSSEGIEKINQMVRELMLFSYSKRYLYDELVKFTKDFPKLIREYKANEGLIIAKELFDEIKVECRKVET